MKKLLMLAMLAAVMIGGTRASIEAQDLNAEFLFLDGTWNVTVAWVNPPINGTFSTLITMTDRRNGTVNAEGHTGSLSRTRLTVTWDFDDIAFYEGQITSLTSMSGTMENTSGNTGTWSAVKTTVAAQSSGDPDALLGQ
jgi:hypothetical protein